MTWLNFQVPQKRE